MDMKVIFKCSVVAATIFGGLFLIIFQYNICMAEGVKWEKSIYVPYIDKEAKDVQDLRFLMDEKWDSEVLVKVEGAGEPVSLNKCTDLIDRNVVGTLPDGPRTFSNVMGLKQSCTAMKYVSSMSAYEKSYLPYSAREVARLLFVGRRGRGSQEVSVFLPLGEKSLQKCFGGNECVFVGKDSMQYSVSVVASGDYDKDAIADLVVLLKKKPINGAGVQYMGLIITRMAKSSRINFIKTF